LTIFGDRFAHHLISTDVDDVPGLNAEEKDAFERSYYALS
jgi:hypothetical protein